METAINTRSIGSVENPPGPLTYEFLREEGLRHIRDLGGKLWSDHNVGDPGITMLEVLCVAIADISTRTNIDIKQLVANEQGELYDNIRSPKEILPCNPLTRTDFRKLLIDLPEVKNVWVEPTNDNTTAIYHNRINQNISLQGPEENKVAIKGLYTVFIETEKEANPALVKEKVADSLNKHRNLCEAFSSIRVLAPQEVAINATLEIGEVSDVAQLLATVYAKLDRFISPHIRSYTLQERLGQGKRLDEIMEGPWLENGFIDTEEVERAAKRKELRSSDLIQEIMDVPGVSLVKHIQMHARKSPLEEEESTWQQASWILPLELDKAPQLIAPGQGNNKITLIQGSVTVATIDWDVVRAKYDALQEEQVTSSTSTQDFKLEKSSVNDLGKYDSIQENFPNTYGIGKYGLSERVSPLRKAQARQLKAYLLFFDQLLANYVSQLANARQLFAYDEESVQEELKTYFPKSLFEVVPNLDTVISRTDYEEMLDIWQEETPEKVAVARDRKNRFLSHLMGRFGEKFNEYALLQYTGQQKAPKLDSALRAKYDFLQNYPTVSGQRATQVGLQERIRIQLGLTHSAMFAMVEHTTLRPSDTTNSSAFFTFSKPLYLAPDADNPQYIVCHSPNHGLEAGDVIVVRDSVYYQGIYKVALEGREENKFKISHQEAFKFPKAFDAGQWFRYGTHRDPFSLQLSFVFPTAQDKRFGDKAFQTYAREVIRAETPAHIKVYVHWFDESQMATFERNKESLGAAILEAPFNLGRILPWKEPNANLVVTENEIATGDKVFTIGDENFKSEQGVTYYVRNEATGEPLSSAMGDGKPITITVPAHKITQHTAFDILALDEVSSVGVELIQVVPRYAVVIAGNSAEILVENSQEGSIYELVDADDDQIVLSVEPIAGTGQAIRLFTAPLQFDTKLRIRTTARGGISKTYKKDILIEILKTNLDYNADPIVFDDEKAKIKIQDTQRTVRYELMDDNGNKKPIATALGNGGVVTLTTDRLTADQTFKIKATTLPSKTENTTNHPYKYLKVTPTIKVHPLQLSLIPAYPAPIYVGFPANLKLKSYKNVTYRLMRSKLTTGPYDDPVSKPVMGTGGEITLTTDMGLQMDTHVQVFATIAPIDRPVDIRNVLSPEHVTIYVEYFR